MEFSSKDQNLIEIIEAVGELAIDSYSGRPTANEKKERVWYIDLLVKRYFSLYNHGIPDKSIFTEAVNWYVNKTLRAGNLAETIKNIMRQLVLGSYDRYEMQYNKRHLNPV